MISNEAQSRLHLLSAPIHAILPDHLARLSARPVTLSMPGAPTASLPNRQIYAFPVDLPDGSKYTVRIHFRYGQDEMTLYVIAITAIEHARPRAP